ncbi:class I adenylate-forming enzyme family protein [Herbaspirillum sp. VT-16-41]|uniref:class I adenylate-forming enzyme family protein n=1 Tax=Herbaspirillum sp. VT-16-41 TaxID=1953765 RepID=UPI0009821E65|nr:class I adenylate-forming enzyme family protein [Herbaspirillum sp. VT-16-41]ONN64888.1 long-chain fatty acid--CoA ligase [Herbaspirillum sp. VT-16-41]
MIHCELIAPVGDLLRRHTGAFPDKVAYEDRHRAVSYAALNDVTAKLAGHLQDHGLQPGDAVAILLPNSVDWVESCLAIVRAGGVAVPISFDATEHEVAYRIEDADCKAIFVAAAKLDMTRQLQQKYPALKTVVVAGEPEQAASALALHQLRAAMPQSDPRDDADIDRASFIIYTSGTTGRAKGVLLSQRGMLWVSAACWAPIAGLSVDDRVLSPLPLFHSYALNLSVLGILSVGASEYILDKFSTSETIRLLNSGEFTVFPAVPTIFHYLLEAARADPGCRFPGLRLCLSAGAIMPAPINREFEERFGVMLLDGYGITETSTMVTLNWRSGTRVMGSCGLPLPGLNARIVDPLTGNDVVAGEEGELIVRGPNVMLGYHNKPEETAKALKDGWYLTGDLARSDRSGYLTITGRLKELIIRGGQNIAPAEVEEAVCAFAAVLDCAVVGAPHEHLGEVPVVFVVPRPEVSLVEAELLAHCKERLSTYKLPHAVHVVAEIPRTGSGKIIRYQLRDRLKN